jgi:hypothetical protein
MSKKKPKDHGGARKGAGRKVGKDGPTKAIAATIPESLIEKLDTYAAAKEWTRSRAITEAIKKMVK